MIVLTELVGAAVLSALAIMGGWALIQRLRRSKTKDTPADPGTSRRPNKGEKS